MTSASAGSSDFYIEKRVSKGPIHNMHHHRSFELYFLVKGKREYFIEDRFFAVEEGDLVIIPREVFHRTAGEGGLRYLVHFSERFLEKFFKPVALHPLLESLPLVFRTDVSQREQLLRCFVQMEAAFENLDGSLSAKNEQLFGGYLYQILFTSAYGENTYISTDHSDERITGIVQYINENYNTIRDIEEIAEKFFISKYHLCRFFKKNIGISLVVYLNTIKIRQACVMIRSGHTNLTEVALQSGFNSSSYFCKVFKKEVGISPKEYRLRHKQR